MCVFWLTVVTTELFAAAQPDMAAPRKFTDNRGRSITATVVSIDLKSVVLKRESDGREFVFPILDLSEADQVFIAENRAALGKAAGPAEVAPLPTRKVTGTEVAKAKRFAADVLLSGRSSTLKTFRWTQRPVLTLRAPSGPLADYAQKTYDEFCAAAGFTGAPAKGPEIVVCLGSMAEIEALKQKLEPEAQRSTPWTWRYRWIPEKNAYRAFVFFVPEAAGETENRRQVFRGIAAVFGCPGASTEFPQSSFEPKSQADALDDIDRHLVRLMYTHINDRASRDNILVAVEKNWAAMVSPPKGPATP